ncbi:hypothetical protein SK128_010536 [Halocaridina rubra]|uniref:Uncharacterized protein n=1 Tax=Halocaridina rubra TaxID=373956 RepID=A0AAN9ACS1_HALRR
MSLCSYYIFPQTSMVVSFSHLILLPISFGINNNQISTLPYESHGRDASTSSHGSRDGARGRNENRSSLPTTARTTTNSKELQTPQSGKTEVQEESPMKTSVQDRRYSKVKSDKTDKDRHPSSLGQDDQKSKGKQSEGESGELETTEEPKKRKRRKRRKSKKEQHGAMIDEETEEEARETKMEEFKQSVALNLYRNFAKEVYIKKYPHFKLFGSFENAEKSVDTDVVKSVIGN